MAHLPNWTRFVPTSMSPFFHCLTCSLLTFSHRFSLLVATAEDWIFRLFRHVDDTHPDCHAVRLKLELALLHSLNSTNNIWQLGDELNGYVSKLPHVSASCRLSDNEEIRLLQRSAQKSTLLLNRLSYLQALQRLSLSPLMRIDDAGSSPGLVTPFVSAVRNGENASPTSVAVMPLDGGGGGDEGEGDVDEFGSSK